MDLNKHVLTVCLQRSHQQLSTLVPDIVSGDGGRWEGGEAGRKGGCVHGLFTAEKVKVYDKVLVCLKTKLHQLLFEDEPCLAALGVLGGGRRGHRRTLFLLLLRLPFICARTMTHKSH